MNKEAQFGQIEDYLAEKLDQHAKDEFEQKMSSSSALRDEVALHKDLAKHLLSSPENALLDNLIKLRPSPGFNIKQKWYILTFLLLIVLGGSLFYFNNAGQTTKIQVIENEPALEQKSIPSDTQNRNPSEMETSDTAPIVPNTKPQKSIPEKDLDPKNKQPKSPPVLAGNFTPNSALESYIGNNVRGGNYQFEITKAAFLPGDNHHFFKFTGTVSTDHSTIDKQFQVLLFSNAVETFEQFKPIVSVPLSYTTNTGGFNFDLSSSVDVSSGLYYYLLEDANSGQVFAAGKILLK